ncbi:MAG: DedA family protein [Gemmatimonadota bacterium]|nr:DedA family protein [Gemmatimonadota bacterium]MDH4350753.1 DedA family protein [Gemmatimonadota bacterium]MDH5197015.1 DedA family protein [Gemmatimonadota bacterium]
MLDGLLARLLELPPAAVYAVLAALAAAENVFPPVPADTAVAVGAFLSVGGRVTAWGVFLVVWPANVASAALVYAAARTVGRKFFRGPFGRRLLKREALARIERLYDRHGTWAILVSRFIPGVRAVVPAFAGVANLDPVRAIVPVVIASAVWYGTLTFVAATFIRNLATVGVLLVRFQGLLLGVALIGVVVAALVIRQRRRGTP